MLNTIWGNAYCIYVILPKIETFYGAWSFTFYSFRPSWGLMLKGMKIKGGSRLFGAVFFVTALGLGTCLDGRSEDSLSEGQHLARAYCSMCHDYTDPEILPKKSWNFLLGYMGMHLGVDDFKDFEDASEAELSVIDTREFLFEESKLAPPVPLVSELQWAAIREFYMSTAPDELAPLKEKAVLVEDDSLFSVRPHRHIAQAAINSMVQIDERNQQLLIGDARSQTMTILDKDLGFVVDYPGQDSMWLEVVFDGPGGYLLSIGDLSGGYVGEPKGSVYFIKRVGNMYVNKGAVLEDLYRPADIDVGDLDGDGVDEMVVCNFGVETGDVSVFGKEADGFRFAREPITVLYSEAGAVKCELFDFNGDGLLDVAAMVGNARESFNIFINKGNFEFERKVIVEQGPEFGYIGFQLVDFNADGIMDVVTVNGDNGDSDPYNTLKPYHGIRVYLGDGDLGFEESYFYPMFGAYDVEVVDFDMDGDFDIAGLAFHPDFNLEHPESFVFLEQVAPMEFVAKTHTATYDARWMTMDAGDLDQDGDVDLVLGAGYASSGMTINHPELFVKLADKGSPILFLNNETIK